MDYHAMLIKELAEALEADTMDDPHADAERIFEAAHNLREGADETLLVAANLLELIAEARMSGATGKIWLQAALRSMDKARTVTRTYKLGYQSSETFVIDAPTSELCDLVADKFDEVYAESDYDFANARWDVIATFAQDYDAPTVDVRREVV